MDGRDRVPQYPFERAGVVAAAGAATTPCAQPTVR